ncbi:DUF1648 domain-containing protein [Ureibacillus sp. Re31]|uniref:DUF1648 domain-containing protein n=1 Tax=Ureibacillus galli TaxID=2762222 RepID=A0ABR8XHC5_9BACL|nr:DUF5808 domain-containing protein [Ureibacillus galli]MBD8028632.1 DUF1648 domain-containing protein [Ureibacillus galli]
MAFVVFLIITFFIAVTQIVVPYLVKKTVVFGVTIPEQYINDGTIKKLKKQYAISVALLSIVLLTGYSVWSLTTEPKEEQMAMIGVLMEFGIIFISLSLYIYYHGKVKQLKIQNKWVEHLKQVKVTDLSVRNEDEMLPWYVYLLPIISTLGLMIYTMFNYDILPQQIPTHWGPSGEPDAFTEKTPFSAMQHTFLLLIMQLMFFGVHFATKNSGIKLSASNLAASKNRQLTLRKYSSWFLFFVMLACTILMSFFQLTTIHPEFAAGSVKIILPFAFLIIVLVGSLVFALKVGRSDKGLEGTIEDNIMEVDEDQYWKGGMFYFNKNDPSIFVEKRFGVGWTINFANPIGYLIVLLPLIIILIISML